MNDIEKMINNVATLNALSNLENIIKEAIENKRNELNIKCSALDLSNKSFHCLKETFENMSVDLFKTSEGRKIIGDYKKLVKENKSFSILMTAHESLRRAINESITQLVVNDIIKYGKNIDGKKLDEGIEKMRGLVYASYKLLGEGADSYIAEDNENYSNAIRYIVENKKSFVNLVDFANASHVINESIKNRKVSESVDVDNLVNDIDKAFDKLYVKESIDNGDDSDKEKIFNVYKQECLNKINESLSSLENEDEINKVKKIYEQVESKVYSKDTIDDDVLNLIGITKCF